MQKFNMGVGVDVIIVSYVLIMELIAEKIRILVLQGATNQSV